MLPGIAVEVEDGTLRLQHSPADVCFAVFPVRFEVPARHLRPAARDVLVALRLELQFRSNRPPGARGSYRYPALATGSRAAIYCGQVMCGQVMRGQVMRRWHFAFAFGATPAGVGRGSGGADFGQADSGASRTTAGTVGESGANATSIATTDPSDDRGCVRVGTAARLRCAHMHVPVRA